MGVDTDMAYPSQEPGGLVCPLCKGDLDHSGDMLHCSPCARPYPVHLGIPDFRGATAYSGKWDEEPSLSTLKRLVEAYPTHNLDGLLEILVQGMHGDDEPGKQQLREYLVQRLDGRAAHRAGVIDLLCQQSGLHADFSRSLELGCGGGATMFELARRGHAVGMEPNLLHLIIARKHAEELHLSVGLVCAFAEALPFRDGTFTFVHCMHTVEHFADQKKGLSEMRRVTHRQGVVCFDIPNRYSLWREPHTKIWGIGFLPRRLTASVLVGIRNVSLWSLKRLVAGSVGSRYEVYTALVRFRVPGYRTSAAAMQIARVLAVLERAPVLRTLVRFFQPGFEVIASPSSLGQDDFARR